MPCCRSSAAAPWPEAPRALNQLDLRTYGVGAQILRDIGIAKMRLPAARAACPA